MINPLDSQQPNVPRLGEHLLRLGLITPDQIEVALHEKARSGKLIGTVLVELGFIKEHDLTAALAARSGAQNFDAAHTLIDANIGRRIPQDVAERYKMAALCEQGDEIWLAMIDPYDVIALDQARRYLPAHLLIAPQVITVAELADVHDYIYGYALGLEDILRELRAGEPSEYSAAELVRGFRHPIVRLVNMLLLDAVKQGASDLHFEPEEYFVRVRLRIDGVLSQLASLHKDFWSALSHRLKIIAGMNIADKLSAQDGRFTVVLSGRTIDFRVSSLPGAHGENIVVRVLDQARALLQLAQLGFQPAHENAMQNMLARPEGLIIVTGPTGSGKTTTLYAMLGQLANLERNIMTLEDPIEYQVPLVRQTQIREATGLTFAEGVRAILRQDPDVILIGEIRDAETAQMALRAAMTGHLVLSTMHTRDVFGVLPRLYDLGVSPSVLAGNLNGLVAQRLVRRLCTQCREPYAAGPAECTLLGLPKATLYRAVGCANCRGTGYKGRIPIAEMLVIDDALDELIAEGARRSQWRTTAQAHGFHSMRHDGLQHLLAGHTSLDALMQAIDMTVGGGSGAPAGTGHA